MKVVYVFDADFVSLCNNVKPIKGRALQLHGLIHSYGLLNKLSVVAPEIASLCQLSSFHSNDYVAFLNSLSIVNDLEKYEKYFENYGLEYDCPVDNETFRYASYVAGSTITAAKSLAEGKCDLAINWYGGWHHAKMHMASGFCYFNDVVLGIVELKKKYKRILYIDLDLHHGDGVQEAFYGASSVYFLSFHKYSSGFFPCSGSVEDTGVYYGRYCTTNIPLRDGITDSKYVDLFCTVVSKITSLYQPSAIVCQCGTDTLSTDPNMAFNLTTLAYKGCLKKILSLNLPTMLLGGGGYNISDTCKCWTELTALAVGVDLDRNIPAHSFFNLYGPDFTLEISVGNRPDENTEEYLDSILFKVNEHIDALSCLDSENNLCTISTNNKKSIARMESQLSLKNRLHGYTYLDSLESQKSDKVDVYNFK